MSRVPVQRLSREEIAGTLRATPVFADLDDAAITDLATICGQRRLGRGHVLCHEGDPGDRLYVLAEGTVKVVVSSPHGEELLLETMGAPESLGELALLDGAPRSATVVAVEPTVVLMLARTALLGLMAKHPPVLDALLRQLAGLVRRLTEQTGDFVFLDLGGRLAKALLRLSEPERAGLTQDELASMVGASRQQVNRALRMLADRGWIALDGGRVVELRNEAALRRRAEG